MTGDSVSQALYRRGGFVADVKLTNTNTSSSLSCQGFERPPNTRGRFPVIVKIRQRHIALECLHPEERHPSMEVGNHHQCIGCGGC